MTNTNSLLKNITSENTKDTDILKQEKIGYACSCIITDIIHPLFKYIMDEVDVLNPDAATLVDNYNLERAKTYTKDLYALFIEHKNIDSVVLETDINKSLQKQENIIQEKNRHLDMIGFYPVLQLLECVLENAKDHKKFLKFEDKIIDTPYKLGQFISSFLLNRLELLPQDTDIFARLKYIIETAQTYDRSILDKSDPEADSTFSAL